MVDGGEMKLDSLTMRITGGTDHILRTYVDELTGVSLVVLVLFGPAEPVIPHTPEVCYPASGYQPADDADGSGRSSRRTGSSTSVFRSAVYAKSGGRAMLREGVYYSFRLEGQWSPDVGAGRKFPRRNPERLQGPGPAADGRGRAPRPRRPDRAVPLAPGPDDRARDRVGREAGRDLSG